MAIAASTGVVTFDNSVVEGYNSTFGVQCTWTAAGGITATPVYSQWFSA